MLAFDRFRWEPETGQWWQGEEPLRLSPKAGAVLHYLVIHAGQLVSVADIRQAIWSDGGGSAAALKVCIGEIRKALQDDARRPRFIETQPRHGYRFIAPLLASTPAETRPHPRPSGQSLPSALQLSSPALVGRERDLAQLHQSFTRTLSGERQFVFVSGEPGVGKTTLVNAFVSQLVTQAEPVWVSRGQCVEQYGAGEAYLPLLEALGRLGREPDGPEIVAVLAQYAPTWLAQLPALVLPADREALQRTLVGATRERMLREIAEALEVLTTRRPAILVLEDLHWSDQSTLELLSYLLRRQGSARLLLLGTLRSTEVLSSDQVLRRLVQDLHGLDHAEEVRLGLLTEEQVQRYLSTRLGAEEMAGRSLPELAQWVHGRTEGNPLFMVTMVEYLRTEGMIWDTEGEGSFDADGTHPAGQIPDGLHQIITHQFESLPAPEQQMLEAASVGGMEFAVSAVVAGSEQALEVVEAACAGLAAREHFVEAVGLEEWPDGTLGGRYRFRHALYQNVLYERVPAARRVQLHRRIAERKAAAYGDRSAEIAPELAMHCERGRAYQQAIHYLGLAGETAVRRNAHQEAIELLRRGLALVTLLPDAAERSQVELLLRTALGAAFMVSKGYSAPEVEQTYARARALAQQVTDAAQVFPVLWGLRTFYFVRADYAKAHELADRCLLSARQTNEEILLAHASYALGEIELIEGALTSARRHLTDASALHNPHQPRPSAFLYGHDSGVASLALLGLAEWLLGYPHQARQSSQQAITLAQELDHNNSVAFSLFFAACLHQLCGDIAIATEQTQAAIRLTAEQEIPIWQTFSIGLQGWIATHQGAVEEGLSQIQQSLVTLESLGSLAGHTLLLRLLADGSTIANRLTAGLEAITTAFESSHRTGEQFFKAELYRLKGELLLLSPPEGAEDKSQTEAEACFQQALEIARQQEAKSWELRSAISLGRLWQKQGKVEEAREVVATVYDWFTEGFDTKDLQEAEALLISLGGRVKHKPRLAPAQPVPAELPSTLPSGSPPGQAPSQSILPSSPSASPLFRPEGEYWTLAFAGQVCRVKGTRGMQYLAQLLRAPYQEFFAVALAAGNPAGSQPAADGVGQGLATDLSVQAGLSDAGEVLDTQAQAAYKQRIAELRADLEEAQAFNDPGQAEKLQAELEFLTQELTQAVGLGGRSRKAASSTERARVNVTRAIRAAITRITASHPPLGQYLAQTIKTGTACSYTPDSSQELPWQF